MNAVDLTGQTALHWSAVRGAVQVADLLLEEGARVNAADVYGYQVSRIFICRRPYLFFHIKLKRLYGFSTAFD